MLHLIHSNQLESLARLYAEFCRTQPLPPMERETVVVQNAGMGRWLSMQTALHNKIAANTRYLFPAEATWELLRKVLSFVPERDPCSPKLLRWRLLHEFLEYAERYPELQHYLRAGDEGAAWQLAQQVATVFDGYIFFRPLWIKEWENPLITLDEHDWQGRLWRNVVVSEQLHHWVRLQDEFIQALQQQPPQNLPKRYIFFSIPAVSKAYINLVNQVAQFIDIYFFIVNPTQEYWSDIESEKRLIKLKVAQQELSDIGNPLLASWGTQGRDFIGNLRSLEPYPLEQERFILPTQTLEPHSLMLKVIQADILNLHIPSTDTIFPLELAEDYSVRVHSCHSPMREVQVLYDQILDAIEHDPSLAPSDIVVMTPDIDQYAPYIEAVFGTVNDPKQRLPFSIADQSQRQLQSIITTCLQLLDLPDSRFEAERIFALLENEVVRTQARLDLDDIHQCRIWVSDTNIRWGVDAERRVKQGGADTFEHTWRYGLDRLLLGFAFPCDDLLGEVLPYPYIEGSQAQVLGRFLQWLEPLFNLADWGRQQQSITIWAERVRELFKQVLGDTDNLQLVLQALEGLTQQSVSDAKFERPIGWRIVRDALRNSLEQRNQAEGFMGRGITFCALMPMRSVPFKLVALLGMQDKAFPRVDTYLSFDRLAHDKKQRGDRSRREEDRYLFLESVLSARSRLYISYVGQSIHDNNEIMPSILVTELLDYIEKRFAIEPKVLITKHPLQPFSTRYFSEEHLFTYSAHYAEAYKARHQAPQPFVKFWQAKPLPPLHDDYKQIRLETLVSYYRQPARDFLSKRLNLKLRERTIELPEREPFKLENYADQAIAEQLLAQHLNHQKEPTLLRKRLRAEGKLPHGKPGDLLYEQQVERTEQFYNNLSTECSIEWLTPHPIDFKIDAFQLHGSIGELTERGRLVFNLGKMNAWQWVDIWLKHLALNHCANSPTKTTLVYTSDKVFTLQALDEDTQALWECFISTYWQGMCEPLPCFPKAGLALAEDKNHDLKKAISAWEGSEYSSSEAEKPENALLYRGLNPIEDDPRFVQLAKQFWLPFIQIRTH
ncbi:MAG: exodeoxyribonuclease V subunit gamma [Thiofilum sp.]|uniref:exodeoxyribonuclease V subunit gamma n=1 Tax=Thiofilum sp. TaxID=2212733 RepID=UPI0025EC448F|nr:exodeoxyribonuclease V subunit gamma [Thiofilum sp.]MBK8451877.1 exodeoxyribonuclease V subunit gamma [Thiofilum sp.]